MITKMQVLLATPIILSFFGSAALGYSRTERGMAGAVTSGSKQAARGGDACGPSEPVCGDPYDVCDECVDFEAKCVRIHRFPAYDAEDGSCTCDEEFGEEWTEPCS